MTEQDIADRYEALYEVRRLIDLAYRGCRYLKDADQYDAARDLADEIWDDTYQITATASVYEKILGGRAGLHAEPLLPVPANEDDLAEMIRREMVIDRAYVEEGRAARREGRDIIDAHIDAYIKANL